MKIPDDLDTPYLEPVTCFGCGWQGRRRAYVACANENLRKPCPSCGLYLVEADCDVDTATLAGARRRRNIHHSIKETDT